MLRLHAIRPSSVQTSDEVQLRIESINNNRFPSDSIYDNEDNFERHIVWPDKRLCADDRIDGLKAWMLTLNARIKLIVIPAIIEGIFATSSINMEGTEAS